MSSTSSESYPPTSHAAQLTSKSGDWIELTYEDLDEGDRLKTALNWVRRDDAGAIVSFLGTTRDNFRGKKVTKLEYHAYTALAMKTIARILDEMHEKWTVSSSANAAPSPSSLTNPTLVSHTQQGEPKTRLLKAIVIHRLGIVPPSQSSILIAVSSPHRKEAFEACEWILERVKECVAVWKREWYAEDNDQGQGVIAGDGKGEEDGVKALWKANT